METVVVALGVAIVVVAVLLMSCWKSNKKKSVRRAASTCQDGLSNTNTNGGNPDQGWNGYSDTGTGKINRQLANQYSNEQNLTGYDGWNQVAQYSALEPEVYQSHAEFTDGINYSTSGASSMSIRSDSTTINPWQGLRRPDYASVYPSADARVDSSQYVDQFDSATRYLL
jgi:hypothetical protein